MRLFRGFSIILVLNADDNVAMTAITMLEQWL